MVDDPPRLGDLGPGRWVWAFGWRPVRATRAGVAVGVVLVLSLFLVWWNASPYNELELLSFQWIAGTLLFGTFLTTLVAVPTTVLLVAIGRGYGRSARGGVVEDFEVLTSERVAGRARTADGDAEGFCLIGSVRFPMVTGDRRIPATHVVLGDVGVEIVPDADLHLPTRTVDFDPDRERHLLGYDRIAAAEYGDGRLGIRTEDGETIEVPVRERPGELIDELDRRLRRWREGRATDRGGHPESTEEVHSEQVGDATDRDPVLDRETE